MVKSKKHKRIPKKFYIKLSILVFFLILAIAFAIINSGSGYEKDYVDEYKIEEPVEEKNKSLTTSTEVLGEEMLENFVPLITWMVIIGVGLTILGSFIRIFRRGGMV